MTNIWLIFALSWPICSSAQMALPSVFPEMRMVNPALISYRRAGNIRLSALSNNITKSQDLTTLNGSAFSAKESSKISYTDGTFFRGGKGGNFTTEFLVDYCKGKRTTTLTDSAKANSSISTEATSNYASFGLGAGSFGIDLHYVSFNSNYLFKQTFNGTAYNQNHENKVTITGIKPGIVLGGPNISFGLTAEYNLIKSKNNYSVSESEDKAVKYFGMAIAIGGANSLIEMGMEMDPLAKEEKNSSGQTKTAKPMKGSFIAETKLGPLTLGYKAMSFKGAYYDLDKIIPSTMVYQNPGDEMRMEHVINFSIGGGNGFKIGGSALYSKTTKKEKSTFFESSEKYDTQVKELAASIKLSYVY